MNRRDFLFLRRTPLGRTLELSCHDLYIRTLNASAPTSPSKEAVYDHQPWMGEPPADFQKSDADDWLRQVEAQLRDVEILKLIDREWLTPTGINEQLEPVLTAFRARGGRVEYGTS
jgi:hypothetical protein